uniref:Probable G-protein coupled receptor Mth-like 12 n=1 Tax=Drosophila rhopaloa TaxID=1041015 RepID=A0A6P4EA03_DRORH
MLKVCSVIMFLRTIIYIWNVKREMKSFSTEQATNFDSETYIQFTRISFIMGVNWLLEFCSVILSLFWPSICGFAKNLNLHSGVIIFVVLILKRNTIKMIMDSTRVTQQKKHVRTQRVQQPA